MGRKDPTRGERQVVDASQPEHVAEAASAVERVVSRDAERARSDNEESLDLAALLDSDQDEPATETVLSEAALLATSPSAANHATARARWRQLLAGSTPREVLARLVPQDPLKLRELVAERLRARCYLCDADRVFLRSLARVARFAVRYRGQPDITTWLQGLVDEALLDVLREERESELPGAQVDAVTHAAFVDLARPLGLDPAAMRGACSRFNQLPETERSAFFALLIDGRELDELARSTSKSATELARSARRGLELLLTSSARQTAAGAGSPTGDTHAPGRSKEKP